MLIRLIVYKSIGFIRFVIFLYLFFYNFKGRVEGIFVCVRRLVFYIFRDYVLNREFFILFK